VMVGVCACMCGLVLLVGACVSVCVCVGVCLALLILGLKHGFLVQSACLVLPVC
jgi:hypothetical protein